MTEDLENRNSSLDPVESEQVQAELFPLVREQIEIEHRRIESNDRRTEIMRDAIKASTAAEELQYKYHMARLESDERASQSRYLLAKQVVYVGGGALHLLSRAMRRLFNY